MQKPQNPRVVFGHMENISQVGRLNFYTYRTPHSLEDLLAPDYFKVFGGGLERHDRIEVTCSCDTSKPEHALLVVTDSGPVVGLTVELLRGATGGK